MDAGPVPRRDEADDKRISPRRRILLIEDEFALREQVADCLELEGFNVMPAATSAQALRLAAEQAPDLLIVDSNLLGSYGFEVASGLRATSAIPILVLIERAKEANMLAAFEVGADDFLTKPFRPLELVMCVRALTWRPAATSAPAIVPDDVLRFGDMVIRPRLREAMRDAVPLDLKAKEFDLLAFLAAHPKQVFTRQQLLRQVWHQVFGPVQTVTVHMSRLRAKVERDPSKPSHLRTVRGVGYRFAP